MLNSVGEEVIEEGFRDVKEVTSVFQEIQFDVLQNIYDNMGQEEDTERAIITTPTRGIEIINCSAGIIETIIIALHKEIGYFDSLVVKDVPEEHVFKGDYINSFREWGIVFKGEDYLTTTIRDKKLAILKEYYNEEELFQRISEHEKLYGANLTNIDYVYVDEKEMTYKQYIHMRDLIKLRDTNTQLIYHNKLSEEEYQLSLTDIDIGHISLEGSDKLSDFKSILDEISLNNTLLGGKKYADIVTRFVYAVVKSGASKIVIDIDLKPGMSELLAYLTAVYNIKLLLRSSAATAKFVEVNKKLHKREYMMVEDRKVSYDKTGIKIYYTKEVPYIYYIDTVLNKSTFKGVKLHEALSLTSNEVELRGQTNKPVTDESAYKGITLKTVSVHYQGEEPLPEFKSVKTRFNLDTQDEEEYYKNSEYVNRVIYVIENSLFTDTSKLLTIQDIAIIDLDGEEYIGTFKYDFDYIGFLISQNQGVATTTQYTLSGDDVHNLLDMRTLTDYEESKQKIIDTVYLCLNKQLDKETILSLMDKESSKDNLKEYLPVLITRKDFSKHFTDSLFEADLYDVYTKRMSNNVYSVIKDYLSLKYLRARGNKVHVDIFRHIYYGVKNSKNKFYVNYKMFDNSENLSRAVNYLEETMED